MSEYRPDRSYLLLFIIGLPGLVYALRQLFIITSSTRQAIISKTVKLVYVSSLSVALETAAAKWLGDCIYSWYQNTLISYLRKMIFF